MNRPVNLYSYSHQASPDRSEVEQRSCLSEESSFNASQDGMRNADFEQTCFILWRDVDRFISLALAQTNRSIRSGLEEQGDHILQNKNYKTTEMQSSLCSCHGIRLDKTDRTMFDNRVIRTRCLSLKLFRSGLGFLPFYPTISQQKPDNIQIASEFQRSINCEQSNLRSRSFFELSLSSWKDRSHNMRTRLFRRRSRIYASFGQL